jgi:hypothetical protein
VAIGEEDGEKEERGGFSFGFGGDDLDEVE